MGPPMRHSKHVESPKRENCLDKISNLPDELLGHILSFLPTRFAVSTSILSTRWRYLFTLTTCLSFEDCGIEEEYNRTDFTEVAPRFKEFVDKFLELHQVSPIKKFSLLCRSTYKNSDLNQWVSHALKKGVQELHYELANRIDCMPDGFFTCETLVNLKMIDRGCNKIEIPLSTSLPKLKILHLGSIKFNDLNFMERLLSRCECLQKLTLEYCRCYTDGGHATHRTGILKVLTIRNCSFERGTFEIDAPNLTYLKYSSNIGVKMVPSWKNLRSGYDDFDTNEGSPKYDHELLNAAACKATKFHFKKHAIKLFFQLDEDKHMSDFASLSSVQVNKCPYNAWEYVTSLMDKSPQLETVVFESCFLGCSYCAYYDDLDDCQCNSQSPNIPLVPFSCHVQVIEVHNFCGLDPDSWSFMEHLLTNASRLKRFFVHMDGGDGHDLERDLELGKYLLMLPRASKDCHVEFNFVPGTPA
ncbi:F-box protein At4g22280-like [Silene latifolia]|uniref:F-box protein At4g22280-like n=1 Tax=Silene latifolia TaxID=37657 RepID=UPI003D77E9C1